MPDPKPPAGTQEKAGGSTTSAGTSVAAKALAGGGAPVKLVEPTSEEGKNAKGPYFSITLCVGKYIYSSVIGVHLRVLTAIFNNWLREVPMKKAGPQQLVRLRLRDVAPIVSTPPAPERAL